MRQHIRRLVGAAVIGLALGAPTLQQPASAQAAAGDPLAGAERIGSSSRFAVYRQAGNTLLSLPAAALGKPMLWYTEVVGVPAGLVARALEVGHALAAQDAEGLLRFLGLQGFIDGMDQPEPFEVAQRPLAGCMHVHAPHAGVVVFADTLGREVAAGERIADLVDPVSGESTPLCSPVDGLHFARELQRWAQAGQSVAKVAGRQALRSGKLLSA